MLTLCTFCSYVSLYPLLPCAPYNNAQSTFARTIGLTSQAGTSQNELLETWSAKAHNCNPHVRCKDHCLKPSELPWLLATATRKQVKLWKTPMLTFMIRNSTAKTSAIHKLGSLLSNCMSHGSSSRRFSQCCAIDLLGRAAPVARNLNICSMSKELRPDPPATCAT